MKPPMPPPAFHDLLQRTLGADPLKFTNLYAEYGDTISQQPYLTWDEVRYRPNPPGLKPEEWWLVIKMARQGMQRRLPLFDHHGRPFQYALPDDVLREIEFVNANMGGRIGVREEIVNPATRDRYLVNSLIEEAVTSSQLEGASTTRQVAKDMIRSRREPLDRSEKMILNNFRAMEQVSEMKNERLTPDFILELHRIVTEGTLDNPDAAGRFQLASETRVGVYDSQDNLLHAPPPAETIPERMQALCDFANGTDAQHYLPGVLRALTIHFMIGYEHPFEDGNGRTARALFYWSMLSQGYWLAEFVSVSRILRKAHGKYTRSYLYTETDDNDLTYFFNYHLGVLHRSINDLNTYLDRKIVEVREIRTMLSRDALQLNQRQLALLNNALRDPDATYTLRSHGLSHRVSIETARQDLAGLEARGFLHRTKISKKFVFMPIPELAEEVRKRRG